MNGSDIGFLLAGALAGGFINGLAGFGTALFALGFFLSFMPPLQAVAVVLILSVTSGLQGLWLVRREILQNPVRLARFLIPAFIGIPLGVIALSVVDTHILKLGIAGFLILYGGYFSLRKNLPSFAQPTHLIDSTVGFLGGVLGGAASLSGALPTIWCSMKPWPKRETRAVLQPYNFAVLFLTIIILFFRGAYTTQTLTYVVIAIPATIIAAQIGISIFSRLTDIVFRRLLISLTLVSGTILGIREILSIGL